MSVLKTQEGSTCDAVFCVVLFVCVFKVLFYYLHFLIVIVGLHVFCWCVLAIYVLADCLLIVFVCLVFCCYIVVFLLTHMEVPIY